jgi:hypothetical protein
VSPRDLCRKPNSLSLERLCIGTEASADCRRPRLLGNSNAILQFSGLPVRTGGYVAASPKQTRLPAWRALREPCHWTGKIHRGIQAQTRITRLHWGRQMHGYSPYFSTGMTWFNFPDVQGRKLHQHACGCVITKLSAIYDFCANSSAERHGTDGVCNCHLVSVMCWRVVKQDSSARPISPMQRKTD